MSRLTPAAALFAVLVPMALLGCSNQPADPSYCGVSRTGYSNALAEVNKRLSSYQRCIDNNATTVDCSGDFSALGSAQSNLDAAVADVQKYCSKVQ
jgi:hypothetical protein